MFKITRAFVLAIGLTVGLGASALAERPPSETGTRLEFGKDFPRLKGNYKILAPATDKYNCIAWSLGITTKWVWPGERVGDFDKLNAQYGYRRLKEMDLSHQAGYEKIVLYGKVKDGVVIATHQALQMKDGKWTSKLGKLPLIRHQTVYDLNGPGYGKPIAVYIRTAR